MSTEAAIASLGRRIAVLDQRTEAMEADLGRRIAVLEQAILATTGQTPPPPAPESIPVPSPPPPTANGAAGPPAAGPWTAAPPTEEVRLPPPPTADAAIAKTGTPPARRVPSYRPITAEDVLRIAGVGLVGLAAVFLVSTAITRGWIGPELQLLGAALIGFALLGSALHLSDRARVWATTLGIGGAAVVTICAGAAYGWLELVGPSVALGLVAVAAGLSTAVAVRLRSQWVAIAATVAMLIVPPFARIITDGPVLTIGGWLAAFAVIAAATGFDRGWPWYRLVSTWATALWTVGLAAALFFDDNTDHLIAGTSLVAVVGAVLWLGPIVAARLASGDQGPGDSDGQTADHSTVVALEYRALAAVPVVTWWTVVLFGGLNVREGGALLGLAMAAGFVAVAIVARLGWRWATEFGLVANLMGAGLLLTVSIVLWFGGPVLIVALAAQGLVTLVVAKQFDDWLLRLNGAALAVVAWLLVLGDLLNEIEVTSGGGAADGFGNQVARVVAVGCTALSIRVIGRRYRDVRELLNGAGWLAALLVPISWLSPVVDGRPWLVVGTVAALVSVAAAVWLGRLVLGIGGAIGVLTVAAAGVGIIDATVKGLTDEGGLSVIDHLSQLTVVAAVAVLAAWLWNHRSTTVMASAVVTAWVLSLGWLASVLAAIPQAQVAISAVWALAACGAIVAWVRTGRPIIRVLGFATLAVVLVKLLTVDLAEVETLWRVGLFLVIGLGLLRLGYVLPSLAGHDSSTDPERQP